MGGSLGSWARLCGPRMSSERLTLRVVDGALEGEFVRVLADCSYPIRLLNERSLDGLIVFDAQAPVPVGCANSRFAWKRAFPRLTPSADRVCAPHSVRDNSRDNPRPWLECKRYCPATHEVAARMDRQADGPMAFAGGRGPTSCTSS